MPPADSASRAGAMPKASGDPSSRTFGTNMKRLFVILAAVLGISIWIVVLYARVSDSTKRLITSEQKCKELEKWIEQYRWIPTSGVTLSFPEELNVHSVWIYKDVILISPKSGLGGKDQFHGYSLSSIASPDYHFEGKAGWVDSDGAYAIPLPTNAPQNLSIDLK